MNLALALGICAGVAGLLAMGFWRPSLRRINRSGERPYLNRYGASEQTLEQAFRDRLRGTWRARLHHFVGPDDAGHHNHPFLWSFSIVLWGSYTEEVLLRRPNRGAMRGKPTAGLKTRRVRFFNWIPQEKYHRIVELHGDVWTLFVTGPRVASWGFWEAGRGHIPWRQYNEEKGINVQRI